MGSPPPPNSASHSLLARAHSPASAQRIYLEKIQHKPLFLRPTSPDHTNDARTQRQLARAAKKAAQRTSAKPRPLSAKQKRVLGVYEIPEEQRKYDVFVPLWRMWCGYAREILGLRAGEDGRFAAFVTPSGAGPMLSSADLHGAELLVVRSRCVGRVGTKGIVVRDTKHTFEIITPKNELKTVPKEHTIFRVEVPLVELERPRPSIPPTATPADAPQHLVFELHGDRFIARAPDRATRKVGLHIAKDI